MLRFSFRKMTGQCGGGTHWGVKEYNQWQRYKGGGGYSSLRIANESFLELCSTKGGEEPDQGVVTGVEVIALADWLNLGEWVTEINDG